MPDMYDHAQDIIEQTLARDLKNAGVGTFKLDPGDPGKCCECGYFKDRLVRGVCAPCRDERRLQ